MDEKGEIRKGRPWASGGCRRPGEKRRGRPGTGRRVARRAGKKEKLPLPRGKRGWKGLSPCAGEGRGRASRNRSTGKGPKRTAPQAGFSRRRERRQSMPGKGRKAPRGFWREQSRKSRSFHTGGNGGKRAGCRAAKAWHGAPGRMTRHGAWAAKLRRFRSARVAAKAGSGAGGTCPEKSRGVLGLCGT